MKILRIAVGLLVALGGTAKEPENQGKHLHPTLFGLPAPQGMGYREPPKHTQRLNSAKDAAANTTR